MNNSIPKVSVVMSFHNDADYIEEAIQSILKQTFNDFEFIIINDCSSDGSAEIVNQYASKDERIIVIKNSQNLGLTKSLNKGIQAAKGKYIARQDADDVSLPFRLEKEVSLLESHPEIGLVSCNLYLIDDEGNCIGQHKRKSDPNIISWYLLFHNHIGGHSQVMYRKQLVGDLGGYDENRRYSQDYELWSRLMLVSKIAVLPDFLLKRRKHSQSISTSKSFEQRQYSLIQSKNNIEKLIGKDVSVEEAERLRSFWIGHHHYKSFPEVKYAEAINARLTEIYQAFVQQKNVDSQVAKQLRFLIGKQFNYWIQDPLTIEQNLASKFKLSYYAFQWYWLRIPFSWLMLFANTTLTSLKAIFPSIYVPKKMVTIDK